MEEIEVTHTYYKSDRQQCGFSRGISLICRKIAKSFKLEEKMTQLDEKHADWRRILFLVMVVPVFALLGWYLVDMGVRCYLGSIDKDDDALEILDERNKKCFFVNVDSLAVTSALFGVCFIILAIFAGIGAIILLRNPEEVESCTPSEVSTPEEGVLLEVEDIEETKEKHI